MSEDSAEKDARERYLAWEPSILARAAEHGCLDENVETGDPVVCGACYFIQPAEDVTP